MTAATRRVLPESERAAHDIHTRHASRRLFERKGEEAHPSGKGNGAAMKDEQHLNEASGMSGTEGALAHWLYPLLAAPPPGCALPRPMRREICRVRITVVS